MKRDCGVRGGGMSSSVGRKILARLRDARECDCWLERVYNFFSYLFCLRLSLLRGGGAIWPGSG